MFFLLFYCIIFIIPLNVAFYKLPFSVFVCFIIYMILSYIWLLGCAFILLLNHFVLYYCKVYLTAAPAQQARRRVKEFLRSISGSSVVVCKAHQISDLVKVSRVLKWDVICLILLFWDLFCCTVVVFSNVVLVHLV